MGFNGPPMRNPASIPEVKWTPARGETIKVPTLTSYNKGDRVGFAKDGTLSTSSVGDIGIVLECSNEGGKIRLVSIATYVGALIPVQFAAKAGDKVYVHDWSDPIFSKPPVPNIHTDFQQSPPHWSDNDHYPDAFGHVPQKQYTTTNTSGANPFQTIYEKAQESPESAKIEESKPPEPIVKQVVEQRSARSIRV